MVRQITVNGEQVILGKSGALVAGMSEPGCWHIVRAGQCDRKGYALRGHCPHLDAVKARWTISKFACHQTG